jgi:DNA-binding MarR family transcriptional regulator
VARQLAETVPTGFPRLLLAGQLVDIAFMPIARQSPTPPSEVVVTAPSRAGSDRSAGGPLDVSRYAPAYFTWIAHKLSHGASQHYRAVAGVGIEVWRCLVLLAAEGRATPQHTARVIGMDKGSVSRCFRQMQNRGLITVALDPADGRARVAHLTSQGRALHDRIRAIALERERAFLAVLTPLERETLLDLLRRLHDNLPAVETATERWIATHRVAADASPEPP